MWAVRIRRINRVLDAFILILVVFVVIVAVANTKSRTKRYVPPVPITTLDLKTTSFSPEKCAEYDELMAYYTACIGGESVNSVKPMTCPETAPARVASPPVNRRIASSSAFIYEMMKKRGKCDQIERTTEQTEKELEKR